MFDYTNLTPCPLLHPTEEEFANPIAYLSRPDILHLGTTYGLVKVVPPATHNPPFSIHPDFTFHTRLQTISDLGITTRSRSHFTAGLNRFLNMKRRLKVGEYFVIDRCVSRDDGDRDGVSRDNGSDRDNGDDRDNNGDVNGGKKVSGGVNGGKKVSGGVDGAFEASTGGVTSISADIDNVSDYSKKNGVFSNTEPKNENGTLYKSKNENGALSKPNNENGTLYKSKNENGALYKPKNENGALYKPKNLHTSSGMKRSRADFDESGTNRRASSSETGTEFNKRASSSETGTEFNKRASSSETGTGFNKRVSSSETGTDFNKRASRSETGTGFNKTASSSEDDPGSKHSDKKHSSRLFEGDNNNLKPHFNQYPEIIHISDDEVPRLEYIPKTDDIEAKSNNSNGTKIKKLTLNLSPKSKEKTKSDLITSDNVPHTPELNSITLSTKPNSITLSTKPEIIDLTDDLEDWDDVKVKHPLETGSNNDTKLNTNESDEIFNKSNEPTKIYYYDIHVAIENLGGIHSMNLHKWETINTQFKLGINSQIIKNQYEHNVLSYSRFLQNHEEEEFWDSDEESSDCLICNDDVSKSSEIIICDNCDNPFHLSCLTPRLYDIPSGNWFCSKCLVGTGDYGFEEERDIKYSLRTFWNKCKEFDEKFKKEYNNGEPLTVEVIEQKFWNFVDNEKSDLTVHYGADIHNSKPGHISGFPMNDTPGIELNNPKIQEFINHPFNLTKLPFSKGSLLNFINHSISGMTVPWIYVGSLLATFCWHVEDHYTLSANYCHMGATKKWYGIPSNQADEFELLMRNRAPDLFKKQPDLLHQLVSLINPMTLIGNGIKCVYANQNPGEYVITYPRVYHAGFNCGFNFNEAVNFTMNNWLSFGEEAIEAYKLIKKENVFSHFQLIENILRTFNLDKRIRRSKDDIKLIKECCNSFENFLKSQLKELTKLNLKDFSIVHKPRKMKNRHFYEFDLSEEESLCDVCKTYVSFQYCILNNSTKTFGKPKIDSKQLLTPESSPQEIIMKSNASISIPNQEDLQKLSVESEYDKLINDAKRAAKEEDSQANRRKLRRLEKKAVDIKIVKKPIGSLQKLSLLKTLQSKTSIRLCLECSNKISKDYEIPANSILIYENTPSNLQVLIDETKRGLQEIKIR